MRGGTGDHVRLRKILRDGTILRTRISHGSGEIGDPGLWKRIWRDQLRLATEEEFWGVLQFGRPARRGDEPPPQPRGASVPAWVVVGLLRAGVPEPEVRALPAADAERRLREIWSSHVQRDDA